MTDDISRIQQTQIHTQQIANQAALEGIFQEESEESMQALADEAFNPTYMARRFEQLEIKTRRQNRKEDAKAEQKEEDHLQVTQLEEVSEQFERKNTEL